MSENNSDLGAFLAGFVIGGLVGAATALLLAPQSGEQTRTRIKETSDNLTQTGSAYLHEYGQKASDLTQTYAEKANTTYADVKNTLQEKGSTVQEQARSAVDVGKEKAEALRKQARQVKNQAQDQASQVKEQVQDQASQVKDQVSDVVQNSGSDGDSAANGSA